MSQHLKILNIVGARPNLPKIAPLMREMQRHPEIEAILVHTGQHYDEKLSDIFFRQMGIPSPQVNRHKDERFGTHHARDAWHLFKQNGHDLNLFSSAIKVNSQYMHAVHFNIRLKRPTTVEEVLATLKRDDRVALTYKQSANSVFSFGRDYGHYGRILNQAVVVAPTLAVHNGREVVGFCFTPQDGNALISSVAAAAWFVYPESYEAKLSCLKDSIFDEV